MVNFTNTVLNREKICQNRINEFNEFKRNKHHKATTFFDAIFPTGINVQVYNHPQSLHNIISESSQTVGNKLLQLTGSAHVRRRIHNERSRRCASWTS